MKKNLIKKLICMALISSMMLSLTACGSSDKKENAALSLEEEKATADDLIEEKISELSDDNDSEKVEADAAEETEEIKEEAEEDEDISNNLSYPDDIVTLPFTAESEFHPEDYPDLEAKGSLSETEIDHLVEGVDDLISFDPDDAGITYDYMYGLGTCQSFYTNDAGTRIVSADISTENPIADKIMKKVGYNDYYITFYYTHAVWGDPNEACVVPVYAQMDIDGKSYEYYFCDSQLARRIGPDGTSDNIKTNDFTNDIYKLGCYYGNVLEGERGRYGLFVMNNDCIEKQNDKYVITCGVQGREGTYSFTIDNETKMPPENDGTFMSGYRKGESVYEWYDRTYFAIENDMCEEYETEITALMGIFDVKTTDGHVDYLCECYWWD